MDENTKKWADLVQCEHRLKYQYEEIEALTRLDRSSGSVSSNTASSASS